MPDPVTGLIAGGTALVGGAIQAKGAEKASKNQAKMQVQATEASAAAARQAIEEVRTMYASAEEILAPFMDLVPQQIQELGLYQRAGAAAAPGLETIAGAAGPAFQAQAAIAGLEGPEAQREAIANIESSPEFQAMVRQGEEAILQGASATGGLRGGNVQAALAQFRPAMLNRFVQQQYERLGGLTRGATGVAGELYGTGLSTTENLLQRGFGAVSDVAANRQGLGNRIANIITGQGQAEAQGLMNIGAAQAGREVGQAGAIGGAISDIGRTYGLQQAGAFGGSAPMAPVSTATPVYQAPFAGGYNPAAININAGLSTPII